MSGRERGRRLGIVPDDQSAGGLGLVGDGQPDPGAAAAETGREHHPRFVPIPARPGVDVCSVGAG